MNRIAEDPELQEVLVWAGGHRAECSASQILWSFSKVLKNSPQDEARATPAAVSNPSPNSIFLFQGSEQDREAAAEVDNGVLRLFDFLMTFIQTQ